MRSPLKVRREELACTVAGFRSDSRELQQRPVFTLHPDALFSSSDYDEKDSAAADLHTRLTWAPALAETLIEDEREDDENARQGRSVGDASRGDRRPHGRGECFGRGKMGDRQDDCLVRPDR